MSLTKDITLSQRAAGTNTVAAEVLYVAENSPWGKLGYEAVAKVFRSVRPIFWSSGMPKPDLSGWHGDWIISFKSDLILSQKTLDRAAKGALNFHPSPPKYRGLGGYWWALHNGDKKYAVTVHHMDAQIDHGAIIKTDNFGILPKETVESLKERAAIHALRLLHETLDKIKNGIPLNPSGEQWEPHLYTNRELKLALGAQATTVHRALAALEAIQGGIVELSKEKTDSLPAGLIKTKLALG